MYYGLVIKGTNKLLGYEVRSNSDGDFCCENQYILTNFDSASKWLVTDKKQAKEAAETNTNWYNADYETPSHGYGVKEKELEVVEVELTIKINGKEAEVPKSMLNIKD